MRASVPVGPADFLRALRELGAEAGTHAELAAVFGYSIATPALRRDDFPDSEPKLQERRSLDGDEHFAQSNADSGNTPAVFEESPSNLTLGAAPEWWANTQPLEEEAPGQAVARTPPAPLFHPARQRDVLRTLLARRVKGRRIDIAALLSLLAKNQPYERPPMLLESRLATSVALVSSRSPYLETFDNDVRLLAQELRALVGSSGLTLHSLRELPQALPETQAVLIVMRGRPEYDGDPSPAREWFELATAARACGASVTALCPETLAEQFYRPLRTIEWSRRTSASHRKRPYTPLSSRRGALLELATLLAPAVRIEPSLLREARLSLLPEAGPEVEAELRTSRWVATSNSLGFALRPDIRRGLLRRLERHPQRDRAFQCVEDAHRASPPVLRLEERLARLSHQRPDNWQQQVEATLREATRALTPERKGLARWVQRAFTELPKAILETLAFAEARVRSESMLGPESGVTFATALLAPEVADFLRGTGMHSEHIEIVVSDPESRALMASDLEGVPEAAFEAAARKLRTSASWAKIPNMQEGATFRMDLLRRALRHETHRGARFNVIVLDSPAMSQLSKPLIEILYGLVPKGMHLSMRPAGDSDIEQAQVVFALFEDQLWTSLLARARSQPNFLLCLLHTHPLPSGQIPSDILAFAELIDARELDRTKDDIESLMLFAGRGSEQQVRARPAQSRRPGQLLLAPGSLSQLVARTNSSTEAFPLAAQPIALPRQTLTLSVADRPVGTLRAAHDLWIARLYRAACRVVSGRSDQRTGCLVNERYVATAAEPASDASELIIGAQVTIEIGDEPPRPATVKHVIGGLAVIELDSSEQLLGSLRAVSEPAASGIALALLQYKRRPLGHLVWGRVELDASGAGTFVMHVPLPAGPPHGVTVLVEGLYAGQLSTLVRRADGAYVGTLSRAQANFFPDSNRPAHHETSVRSKYQIELLPGALTRARADAIVLSIFRDVPVGGAGAALDHLLNNAVSNAKAEKLALTEISSPYVDAHWLIIADLGVFEDLERGELFATVEKAAADAALHSARHGFKRISLVTFADAIVEDTQELAARMLAGFKPLAGTTTLEWFEPNELRFESLRGYLLQREDVSLVVREVEESTSPPAPTQPGDVLALVRLADETLRTTVILPSGSALVGEHSVKFTVDDLAQWTLPSRPDSLAALEALGRGLGMLLFGSGEAGAPGLASSLDRRLVVQHDIASAGLPFEALSVGGRDLSLEGGIVRRPSLTGVNLETTSRRAPRSGGLKLLLIVNPTLDLPNAEIEAAAIRSALTGSEVEVRELRGAAATREAVLEGLTDASCDVLHFAGQAYYSHPDPNGGGLVCADGVQLSSTDLQGRRIGPRTVFFNACQSARLHHIPTPLVAGAIAEYVLRCGVEAYIGTLWEVDDVAAAHFAARVYRDLASGVQLDLAVMNARRLLRANGSLDWANYVLYGSGASQPLRP